MRELRAKKKEADKNWCHGQASTSNPKANTYITKAKLSPCAAAGWFAEVCRSASLTMEAVLKHESCADLQLQKDVLATLVVLPEVINEKGDFISTEYFLALMEKIDVTKKENDTVAADTVLSMIIY